MTSPGQRTKLRGNWWLITKNKQATRDHPPYFPLARILAVSKILFILKTLCGHLFTWSPGHLHDFCAA
jgi:hypothetical protein